MTVSRSRARRAPREDRLDNVFGALADRKRRAILRRLARGPATVSELAAPFDVSLPAMSRHLRVLEEAGLVDRTIEGRVHHCSLAPAALRLADGWLEHYRGYWDATLASLANYVE
jgi:DNA-binding transcriptional ArsR family regulator